MIRVRGLRKAFDGQVVLAGLDLEIPDREIYVVIGRSGVGKSCFLKHLIGLLRPDAGEVWVDGVEIGRLRGRALSRLRSRFGVLFQGGALFDSLTVFENVAFPLREKTRLADADVRRRVREKLAQVGLSGADDKYPSELSGGMRKRAALARALVTDPDILLFDEPTTGLDPIRVRTVHAMILELQRLLHFTAVIVSHEIPEIFEIATRVAMLHDGVIVATGTPDEIQTSSNPVVRQFITGSTQGPIEVN